MANLTNNELTVLKAITESEFYDGIESMVWDFSVLDDLSIKGKKRGGVFSSLSEKGFVSITERQKKYYKDADGNKQRNPYYCSDEPEANYGTFRITEQGKVALLELDLLDEYDRFKA